MLKRRAAHFPGGAVLTAVLLLQEHFADVTGKHEAEQLVGVGWGDDSQEEQDKLSLPLYPPDSAPWPKQTPKLNANAP